MKRSFIERIQILPVGSYEYHGAHLPPETDTIISVGVSGGVRDKLSSAFMGQVIILPALEYGLSLEHIGRPTTAFVSHVAYYEFLKGIVSSVSAPHDLILIINAHGGNTQTLGALEGEFNNTFQDRKIFSQGIYSAQVKDICTKLVRGIDVHAGSVEASLVAYYRNLPAREYSVTLAPRIKGSLRFFRSAEIAPEGVIQEFPQVIADPEKGKTIHESIVDNYTASVIDLINNLEIILSSEGKQ